jgi:hypothetical protein
MRREDIFQSKYFKAVDLHGKAVVLTIETAPLEILKNPKGEEHEKSCSTLRAQGKRSH